MNLEAVNRALAATVRKQEEEIKAANAEIKRLRAALQDPATVHINMLRGLIAKPTLAQIIHLYGDESIRAALTAQPAAPGGDA